MKYSKFLLISSILLLLICTPTHEGSARRDPLGGISYMDVKSDETVNSIFHILSDAEIDENQIINIHVLLQSIVNEKSEALLHVDLINGHVDSLKSRIDEYMQKKTSLTASIKLREKLLGDITKLRRDLNKIRPKSIDDAIQWPIPGHLSSLDDLAPGNYRARINKTCIIGFRVNSNGSMIATSLILDSTTVIYGIPLNQKVSGQIEKLSESLK